MKKCPKCQSVVDSEYECKVCGTSIFYEPYADADRELIAKGYRLRYWLPKFILPIAATVCFFIGLAVYGSIDHYVFINVGLVILSWLLVIFNKQFTRVMLWKYNEDYAKFDTAVTTIILSAASIILSVILMLIKNR